MTTIRNTKLRERRIAQGIKQIELAARAGVSIATLNKAECWGFRVSLPVAERLAKAQNCKPSEIFPGVGKYGVR